MAENELIRPVDPTVVTRPTPPVKEREESMKRRQPQVRRRREEENEGRKNESGDENHRIDEYV